MNDLLLFTSSKKPHIAKLEDVLKALPKNRLRISTKKCWLFRTELQYMGNTTFIKIEEFFLKPLRSRLEAIQKLQPSPTAEGCRSFIAMVNYFSMFCPELQKLLKPISHIQINEERQTIYMGKRAANQHLKK